MGVFGDVLHVSCLDGYQTKQQAPLQLTAMRCMESVLSKITSPNYQKSN